MKNDRTVELDGLRFIAALGVVLFHLVPRFIREYGSSIIYAPLVSVASYGYMGVDLFFIISGFVIVGSAQSASVRDFIVGRIARLYPAFWFCCTLTSLVILYYGTKTITIGAYLANMTMYPRVFGFADLDVPYWTLALELRFYLIIACLIMFRQIRNIEFWLCGWLIATVALILFSAGALRFTLITDYSAYFIAGAMFYFIRKDGITMRRTVVILVCLLLSLHHAVLTVAAEAQIAPMMFAARSSLTACMLTIIFYVVFLATAIRRTGWFGKMNFSMLGSLTYPLYLLHETIGTLVTVHWESDVVSYIPLLFAILVSLIASYIVHRYIEIPAAQRLSAIFKAKQGSVLPAEITEFKAPLC